MVLDILETERDKIRDEILTSQTYVSALSQHGRNIEKLRPVWRDEEFNRRDKVIGLCNKAEELYKLASRLFEALRTDIH